MLNKPVVQVLSKPSNASRIQDVQGDIYDVTGFIPVYGMGVISYSFRGPSVITTPSTPSASAVMPSSQGQVDIVFPVRFSEMPVFTQGFIFENNHTHQRGLYPPAAAVLSWRFGRRDETGLPFYEGARITVARMA